MTSGLTEFVWLSLLAVGQVSSPPVSSGLLGPCSPAAIRYQYPANSVWYPAGTVAPPVLPSRGAVGEAAPPAVPAPLLVPPAWNVAPATVVYRPLIPVVPMPANYQLGRGILGQPTVYVPGQPVRNFLRYLAP
jgi:hypothetical protein